jgi:hypothetical protein
MGIRYRFSSERDVGLVGFNISDFELADAIGICLALHAFDDERA